MNTLSHSGTPMHSGRYPWGSGDRPYQRYEKAGMSRRMINAGKRAIKAGKDISEMYRKHKAEGIIRRANYSEVRAKAKWLTDEDLARVVARAQAISMVKAKRTATQDRGEKLGNDILDGIGKDVIVPLTVGATSYFVKKAIGTVTATNTRSGNSRVSAFDETTRRMNRGGGGH